MKLLHSVLVVCALAALANATGFNPKAFKKWDRGTDLTLGHDMGGTVRKLLAEHAFQDTSALAGGQEFVSLDFYRHVPEEGLIIADITGLQTGVEEPYEFPCAAIIYTPFYASSARFIPPFHHRLVFDPTRDLACVKKRDPYTVC